MNKLFFLFLTTIVFFNAEAVIQVNEFINESTYSFRSMHHFMVVEKKAVFESENGAYQIILEDAGHSGYHRPHWKFNVWLKSPYSFPLLKQKALLYAVVFYDGLGEFSLHINKRGELHLIPGQDVKKIIYPWATATIGRGNPYHNMPNKEVDENGIVYFDQYGFVGFQENYFLDDQCPSFDNNKSPLEINAPMN